MVDLERLDERVRDLENRKAQERGSRTTASKFLAVAVSGLTAVAGTLGGLLLANYSSLTTTIEDAKRALRSGLGTAPIGSVLAWPSTTNEPDGWRQCDGSEIEFTEVLWGTLRGLYGNPNASTVEKIKLPDFRGYFLRGAGGDASAVGAAQKDSVGPHNHFPHMADRRLRVGTREGDRGQGSVLSTGVDREETDLRMVSEGVGSETRPKNYAVLWIMRVK